MTGPYARPPTAVNPFFRRMRNCSRVGSGREPPARHRRGHVGRQGGRLRRRSEAGQGGPPGEAADPPQARLGRAGPRGDRRRGGRGRRRAARRTSPTSRPAASTTRASRCWPGTPRPARRSPRSSPGRTSDRRRSWTGSRPRGKAELILKASGMPLDPYFSAGKLAWLLEHDDAVAKARRRRDGPARDGRLVPLRPPRRRVRHRPVDRVAHPARRARVGPDASRRLRGAAATRCRGSWTRPATSGRLSHPSWPVDLPLRARTWSTSRRRSPAPGASCRGGSRPPTAPACSSSPMRATCARSPRAASSPPSPGGSTASVEWAIDGGVFTAGALLEWLSRDLGLAADPPALAAAAAEVEDSGGVRVLPALAGVGAPWWASEARAVIAGLTAGARPAHIARAALEGIAWRVADVVEARAGRPCRWTSLRVDGGLTRDPTLLQLQADTSRRARPARRGRRDGGRRGGARRGGRRASGIRPRRSRTGSRPGSGSSRPATMSGASARTRSGASSLSARSPSEPHRRTTSPSSAPGTSGSAIARELARFDLRIALIEAGPDVGAGTSKANTAILHTGFDAKPGSLEARLVARGHDLLLAYAEEVGIPLERTGALLVAWDAEQLARFGAITENAERCGYEKVREVGRRRAVRARAAPRPRRARRARGPRRAHRLPLHPAARVRDPGRPRRRRPAPVRAGGTGSKRADGRGWRAGDTRGGTVTAGLGRQRRGAALGRGPPDGGPRRVHGHAQARRADRLRQAEPPAGAPRPAAGAHRRRPRASSSRRRCSAT